MSSKSLYWVKVWLFYEFHKYFPALTQSLKIPVPPPWGGSLGWEMLPPDHFWAGGKPHPESRKNAKPHPVGVGQPSLTLKSTSLIKYQNLIRGVL